MVDAQLRVYLQLEDLQIQTAAFMGAPIGARGYVPTAGQHSLIVEIAPGLSIHRITDLALKAAPEVEPGILFVERQFGILELHHDDRAEIERAGQAILEGIGAKPGDQLRPQTLYTDIIEDLNDQHAVIINRSRRGSLITPGENLLLYELTPALFALLALNEAEKAAPDVTVVEVREIGSAGRVFLSGSMASLTLAKTRIDEVLSTVEGCQK